MSDKIRLDLNSGDITIDWQGSAPAEGGEPPAMGAAERHAWIVLQELVLDDKIAATSPTTWSMSYAEIDGLSPEFRDVLGLPAPEPLVAKVYTNTGEAGRFRRMALDLRSPAHGVLNQCERRGPFIRLSEGRYVLPEKAVRDLEAHLSAGPVSADYESEVAAQQVYHAEAKRLAKLAAASIEPWLEREQYEYPESIEVDLEGDAESGIRIHPRAKGVLDDEIQALIEKNQGNRSVVWRGEGRQRVRAILKPEQRRVLGELQERGRTIKPDDVPDFIDNPEAYLPPGVDLSEFSKRVKGLKIRVYDSRPYLHIRKGELSWFPEVKRDYQARDDDPGGGTELAAPPDIDEAEFRKLAKEAMKAGKSFIRQGDTIIRIDPAAERALEEVEEIAGREPGGTLAGNRRYILDIFENINNLEFVLDSEEEQEEDEAKPRREILEFPLPQSLLATLRPFQVTGYNWLRTLDARKRGGLLADDMGLGKTLQVIGFLAALKENDAVSPSLAVLPKTLINNWFNEIRKFCPDLTVAQYTGGRIDDPAIFNRVDLVVTTYDTLRINQLDLARVDWQVVVCDEAQAIKNPTTGRTTAVKGMKSRMRVAMTGTPVENGLSELWSILDWVQPGLLRSRQEFRTTFERPIVEASDEETRRANVASLQEKIIDHYLRRMKTEVLDGLPRKHPPVRIECPLTPRQLDIYMQRVEAARSGGRGAMLGCLQELLRLCACPWSDEEAYGLRGTETEMAACAKLRAAIDKLAVIRDKGEKVLIFVERLAVQAMLQNVIENRFGIRVRIINGDITSGRQEIVDMFNASDGFQVLILSPRVGGTGLNITSANHVIHYMRPWNPAIENQATDRVYRIGQEKEVYVYLPIATWPGSGEKTVEEVLDELIKGKMELATDVIVPTARMSLDRDVMERIFKVS